MVSEASDVFQPLPPSTKIMSEPPVLKTRDSSSVTLEWQVVEGASGYKVRYREESSTSWVDISTLITANVMRKKGLTAGIKYYFSVKPVMNNTSSSGDTVDAATGTTTAETDGPDPDTDAHGSSSAWEYCLSSQSVTPIEMTAASLHPSRCGYATVQGRTDWLEAHGIVDRQRQMQISTSLDADKNLANPVYYWQLYSLMGTQRIAAIVRSFYERVYEDTHEPWFRDAFARISGVDHHINTQTAFWVDSFGGGQQYHGGDGRLNFHHHNNANSVMTADGAKRWMYHMRLALKEHEHELNILDRRIMPCIVDFLRTKMMKYARDHSWRFDHSDFSGL